MLLDSAARHQPVLPRAHLHHHLTPIREHHAEHGGEVPLLEEHLRQRTAEPRRTPPRHVFQGYRRSPVAQRRQPQPPVARPPSRRGLAILRRTLPPRTTPGAAPPPRAP